MVDYIGRQLGNYELKRLIGEGAFAQVYLGEHVYLGTQAAIKVLNAQGAEYPLDWFQREARTIARLIHPNIVRVLEFGMVDGTPFLVLDYAANGSLRRRHPDGTRLPITTVVSYIKQTAEALQFVHDEKLIHRDIKPENLLLGRRNEVLLSDFGIALLMQTFRSQRVQDVAGTVLYMAPEQIQGQPAAASDQYSLAIIAYEWLAGQRPFYGSAAEIISQHLAATPQPLSRRVPDIPLAVEQVVMTGLEKDPSRRFKTIRAFALALEQAGLLTPPPIASPRVGDASIAPPPIKQAVIQQTGYPVPVQASLPPISAYNAQSIPNAQRVQSVQTRPGTLIASYQGHERAVRSLAWSPNSQQIVSASNEKTVHLWQAATGKQLQLYQDRSDAASVIAWSSDGARFATIGSDALVRVWDFASGQLIAIYTGHSGSTINALAWSPLQYLIASAANDGTIHIWEAATGNARLVYRGHLGSVNSLAWSPNGPVLSTEQSYAIVSGGEDATVQTWDSASGKNIALYHSLPATIAAVAWSPAIYPAPPGPGPGSGPQRAQNRRSSSRVACGRQDGMIEMWDTTSNREVLSYRYLAPISAVTWSPNGRRFAYASTNGSIEVWDTSTNLKLLTFSHPAPVHAMSWSPDGKYIASGGEDSTIHVWIAP